MFALCLDCGATNVRAMLVDNHGSIIGKSATLNSTKQGYEHADFHVWDADTILQQLADCAHKAMEGVDKSQIKTITITTFGVDGGLVNAQGKLLYPVISWKCPRTAEIMSHISKYLKQTELNHISGVGEFAFNTLYKLIWLKENRPEFLQQAKAWLFISNLLAYRLTGVMATDRTMAGTSQLTDIATGEFSPEILNAVALPASLFPPIVDAGKEIGKLDAKGSALLGLPEGIPVISTGHDTQFAVFGSGAEKNQPVLSSGTWEILMVRSEQAKLSPEDYLDGATAEYDADPKLRNPGLQWIGSGIIEWVKSTCYTGSSYDEMDAEAALIPPGCEGVRLIPDFLASDASKGAITGLVLGRTRGHIYRAAMEALTERLKQRLERLELVGGFKSASLVLVGGGARNKIWTQMRADALGIPIKVSKISESTVLGAAMFALAGVGIYSSPEAARSAFNISYDIYHPQH